MLTDPRLSSANLLASRLERLSADSYWAHQASGLRGSLLKCIERIEAIDRQNGNRQADAGQHELEHLEGLTDRGFKILARAAREIG